MDRALWRALKLLKEQLRIILKGECQGYAHDGKLIIMYNNVALTVSSNDKRITVNWPMWKGQKAEKKEKNIITNLLAIFQRDYIYFNS